MLDAKLLKPQQPQQQLCGRVNYCDVQETGPWRWNVKNSSISCLDIIVITCYFSLLVFINQLKSLVVNDKSP